MPRRVGAAWRVLPLAERREDVGCAAGRTRRRARGRTFPQAPFDAGVVGGEPGVVEHQARGHREQEHDEQPVGLPPERRDQQDPDRDGEVVGRALLQAECAGLVAAEMLEAERRSDDRDRAEREDERDQPWPDGAPGRARTSTPGGNVILSHACLPIPPQGPVGRSLLWDRTWPGKAAGMLTPPSARG